MQLTFEQVEPLLMLALQEDIGTGDITSNAVIAEGITARFAFVAREDLVVSGAELLPFLASRLDPSLTCECLVEDGEECESAATLAVIEGNARSLMALERTALNLLQRMCAVATLTAQYVEAVEGTSARIVDTRKTIPGWRLLDKYAVSCGGGQNHRIGLFDGVLIKDNHIAIAGSLTLAVERARAETPLLTRVEVECDTLAQVSEAVAAGADMILLDNMSPEMLREGVAIAKRSHILTEASGNVSLTTVREIAMSGVDYISVGKLTHSAVAVDIGLDVCD
jgi:nicotinate-nucleotide pyrophosphorylase (carboxylating)